MKAFPYPDAIYNDAALEKLARLLRCDTLCMIYRANSGHPGGSLSAVEILSTLYYRYLRHDPANPERPDRDRFVLSKGHACPILYAILAEQGYFPAEEMNHLRRVGGMLQGHPSLHIPGIDASTGSLGQGLSLANGMALAAKLDNSNSHTWCLLGDGELQEGQIWEAAMTSAHYKLDNVTAIVDRNRLQIDGKTEDVMALEPLAEKWLSFGFHVIECDGHSHADLRRAYDEALATKGKPSCVIANTHKGHGVSFMTDQAGWHGKAPSLEQLQDAVAEICGDEPIESSCMKTILNDVKGGGR